MSFEAHASGVTLHLADEQVRVDAWGTDTLRVRASSGGQVVELHEALVRDQPTPAVVSIDVDGGWARVGNGAVTALVEASGRLSFLGPDGVLLAEPWFDPQEPPLRAHRWFPRLPDGGRGAEAIFEAYDDERIYGLGQHTTRRLDLKGCVVDLLQRNSQVAIPGIVSSRGYGLFWNTASVGRVEFAANRTRWVAHRASQMDYVVYAGSSPADVLRRYHELTGFPLALPRWATGYWQSNSYYPSQEELLAVAREHLGRGLPLTAIFVDYMHWTRIGEWEWDRDNWPDPPAMVAELRRSGVTTMVAVWPHMSPRSKHYPLARDRGWLVTDADGAPAHFDFADREAPEGIELALLDLTHPDARAFYWDRVREGYHSIGVRAFWLDASEPELSAPPGELFEDGARYRLGHGTEVSSAFPLLDVRALREGIDGMDDTESVLLVRSAWAGSQRYGAVVWSGDVQSTWDSLRLQVSAGLNMMASGIPWWTSDIGGFFGADVTSEDFRELVVRWFQFAAFWPVMRLHGNRHPDFFGAGVFSAGGPNEVWSFGQRAYEILTELLFLRERLRPYLASVLEATARDGVPPVRPLWFEYPHDGDAVRVEDQFMCGPDLLVAPVLHRGQEVRPAFLPAGWTWRDMSTGATYEGGRWVEVPSPLHVIPLLVKVGSRLDADDSWFTGPVQNPS